MFFKVCEGRADKQGMIDLEGRRRQRVIVSTTEGASGRTEGEADVHQSGVSSTACDDT